MISTKDEYFRMFLLSLKKCVMHQSKIASYVAVNILNQNLHLHQNLVLLGSSRISPTKLADYSCQLYYRIFLAKQVSSNYAAIIGSARPNLGVFLIAIYN